MGMGMNWEGIGTTNLFPHTSSTARYWSKIASFYHAAIGPVSVCPSVCPSDCPPVYHNPVLCRNDWTNQAVFTPRFLSNIQHVF